MPQPHICDDCLMDVYLQTNLKVLVEKRMKKFVAVKVLFFKYRSTKSFT